MKLSKLNPGSFGSNCYILADGGEAVVIDPSCSSVSVMRAVDELQCKIVAILLTHGHFDHMLGLDRLRLNNPEAPVMIHADDAELMPDGQKNGFFQLFQRERDFGSPDKILIAGDVIRFGRERLTVIHTPGHTRGSVCYRTGNILFSGDTIMADGKGRCDLYGGNLQRLHYSLAKLLALPDSNQIIMYPGHGDSARLATVLATIL